MKKAYWRQLVQVLVLVVAICSSSIGAQAADETNCLREQVRTAVTVAAQGLAGVLQNTPEEQKIAVVRAFVGSVRFLPDKSGYFFVYTEKCVNMAHAAQPDLVGKDLVDYKDPNGKFVIRELAAAAKQGGGFVDYVWPKPGADGQFPKIGYAAPIAGTEWFIGSGCYSN